jgi:hypothetical protein
VVSFPVIKVLVRHDLEHLAWIIHEPSLPKMQDAAHEAVVLPPRMRCNTADAVR